MDQMISLTRRVYRLEQELERLKGAPLESFTEIAAPPSPPARPPASAPPESPKRTERELESELVGTWFARIGAIALIIGAGFAFKYGIDRGVIGPGGRIVIGLAAGLAMIGWGEWSRRRQWLGFAQAVTAAGLATMVLSLWAAHHLYGYLGAAPAFASLIAVTLLAVALAVRNDSEALAVLATLGAFIDPLLIGGKDQSASLYAYVMVVDAGVVAIATLRKWPSLNVLGAVASWILFGFGATKATTGVAIGYASAIFALFSLASLLSTTPEESSESGWRTVLAAANGIAYAAAGLTLLNRDFPEARGAFAAFVAAAHVVLGAATQRFRADRGTEATTAVLAMIFFTTSAGLQWRGIDASIAWAAEAALLALAGTVLGNRFLRVSSVAVLGLSVGSSVLSQFEIGQNYHPAQLLISKESLVFGAQIVSALILATLLSSGEEPWERQVAGISMIGANALAVTWLSLEAFAYFRGTAFEVPFARRQAFQFTLSAIWGLYAAALLAVGIAYRSRLVRLLSIALLGLTIAKMALADLWTLTTGFRVLAFLGLGVVLLLTSLSYHRFRDVILGSDEQAEKDLADTALPSA